MAFDVNYTGRIISSAAVYCPNWFSYKTSTDTLATVKASAYFNNWMEDLTNGVGVLAIGDVIHVQASDNAGLIRVTAVTTNVTVEDLVGPGDVDVGDITLTTGSMILGAAGVGAELDVSGDGKIVVGNATTATSVSVSGDATLANTGALTIADSVLEGSNVANVVNDNDVGGLMVIHRQLMPGGAAASADMTLTHKTRIIDAWVVNRGAGTASDTITIQSTANAISDAIDISGADNTVARIGTIDNTYEEIPAGGILRIAEADGGGSDSPACEVYVVGIRVA